MTKMRWVAATWMSCAVVTAACGVEIDVFGDGGNTGVAGNANAGGGAAAGGDGPIGGSTSTSMGGTPSQGGGGNGACVPQAVSAALKPLDMLLLADRSGSMGGSKFSDTIAQLDGFVAQPWPQGTSVGLVYHPAQGVANVCPLALYNPPAVPFEPVPANAGVLQTSLAMQMSGGFSPMSPELEGGLQYATAYKNSEPNHVVAAVLMMDSTANTCDTDISNNAALAAAALTFNGVLTFAVALPGGNVAQMNAIAQAGGTSAAIDLTNPANLSTLSAELSDIRNRLVPCEYALPPTPAGVTFDADEVNLSYTQAGVAMDIPRVADAGACGNTPGWFWDSPATPTTLVMCSATCQTIKQDMAPVVQVVFGCPTLEG